MPFTLSTHLVGHENVDLKILSFLCPHRLHMRPKQISMKRFLLFEQFPQFFANSIRSPSLFIAGIVIPHHRKICDLTDKANAHDTRIWSEHSASFMHAPQMIEAISTPLDRSACSDGIFFCDALQTKQLTFIGASSNHGDIVFDELGNIFWSINFLRDLTVNFPSVSSLLLQWSLPSVNTTEDKSSFRLDTSVSYPASAGHALQWPTNSPL